MKAPVLLTKRKTRKVPQGMLYIPNTMREWPWAREIHSDYEEVKAQSNAWFAKFRDSYKQCSWYDSIDECETSERRCGELFGSVEY